MSIQINVGRLKEVLSGVEDEYVVQLGIHEESDLLKNIFIDSDSGVVEFTNFDDTEKISVGKDMFGNELYDGDKIIISVPTTREDFDEKILLSSKLIKGVIVPEKYGEEIFHYARDEKKENRLIKLIPDKIYKNIIRYEW